MSDILVLGDARSRGIALPTDDGVAQDILDETEALLIRSVGALAGERTERFYVGPAETRGKLGLQRYADPSTVTVSDGVFDGGDGDELDTTHWRMVDRDSAVIRTYSALTRWWSGPYVEVTYEPGDADELRRVLYGLLGLAGQDTGALQAETIGDYSYTRGAPSSVTASRAALIASLLPRRDPLVTLYSGGRRLQWADPVINRAESIW